MEDMVKLRQNHQKELLILVKNDNAQELVINNLRQMHEQELSMLKNELSGYKYIKSVEYQNTKQKHESQIGSLIYKQIHELKDRDRLFELRL